MARVRKFIVSAAVAVAYFLSSAAPVWGAPQLTFTSALGQSATLTVDESGIVAITATDSHGNASFTLNLAGYGDSDSIVLTVDSDASVNASLATASGESLSLLLFMMPEGAALSVDREEDAAAITVRDPSGQRLSASLDITHLAAVVTVSITYDELPEQIEPGRITPLFPGLVDENALGGGMSFAATGLSTESTMALAFHYNAADLDGITESKIRVHRFTNATGAYEPVGENDRGLGAQTSATGDYGVDPEAHAAWAVVDQLGSFAVGVTDDTLGAGVVNDGGDAPNGTQGALCGAAGMVSLLFTFLMLAGMRRQS